jgi:aspartyl-tRNA(Asn)/glutamyl-tRNA(Gln) amidotransferase subunit A
VKADFDKALSSFDVLLAPVAATPAYRIGEMSDPVTMYSGDLMTVNLNLAGLPAVAINSAFTIEDGVKLPIGVQFIGKHLSEAELLGVAHAFELTCSAAREYPPDSE